MSPAVVSGCLAERAHALCDLKEMDLVMQCRTKLEETEESREFEESREDDGVKQGCLWGSPGN
ncbi:hypothetical protein D8674_010756 [Pyrus ussuriensis x Pyrus communis]|uniref:Uncharacterized protein n=1 Tax=Pyrus ussuriensis x Pyrus communis TaxID=2448454 RepID=A0A5N5FBN7_9ROSA|nr:hypothetical protein D8674_010756 [Pyrus ussuriensis x Pyrus communis]